MSQFRFARMSLIVAALGLNLAPGLASAADPQAAAPAAPAESMRPEMYKLVDPAQIQPLMTAKNYTEIKSRIDQAAALPNPNAYESFALTRMRVMVASASGDSAAAMTNLPVLIDSGRLTSTEKGPFIQALGNYYFNAKDYANALVWFKRYDKETGKTDEIRPFIIRAYYFNKDYDAAKKELELSFQAGDQAGAKPELQDLQMYANTAAQTKDKPTYLKAMEKLVQYYPSDEYWGQLVTRVQGKPGFAQQLQIEALRLQFAAVKVMGEDEYTYMAEVDMAAAFPAEAKKVLDAGFAAGVLGTGPNAAKHKQLRTQATKAAADDQKNIAGGEAAAQKAKGGIGLVNLGYAYVTMGQYDKGIALIQQGIAKGGLARPEDAKLRLGASQAQAGHKDDAVKTLASVTGSEGQVDLAVYWTMWANQHPSGAAATAGAQ